MHFNLWLKILQIKFAMHFIFICKQSLQNLIEVVDGWLQSLFLKGFASQPCAVLFRESFQALLENLANKVCKPFCEKGSEEGLPTN